MASLENLEAFLGEARNAIIAGIRKDGRPHLTPNWFFWDRNRQLFYVSTTRKRYKYVMFRRDPRVQLVVDDPFGSKTVIVDGRVEIGEDPAAEVANFRAIREKQGVPVPSDAEFIEWLVGEERVLLKIVPDRPPTEWTTWGID